MKSTHPANGVWISCSSQAVRVFWLDSARTRYISASMASNEIFYYTTVFVWRHASTIWPAGHAINPFAIEMKRSMSLKFTAIDKSRTGIISDGAWCVICFINCKCWSSTTFQLVKIHRVILSLYIFSTHFLKRENKSSLSCWGIVLNILIAAFQHCPPSINDATRRPIRSYYDNWLGSANNAEIRGISLSTLLLFKYC